MGYNDVTYLTDSRVMRESSLDRELETYSRIRVTRVCLALVLIEIPADMVGTMRAPHTRHTITVTNDNKQSPRCCLASHHYYSIDIHTFIESRNNNHCCFIKKVRETTL